MDFSQFTKLLELRQELLSGLAELGPARTPASTALRNRVLQEVRRTSDAVAAAKPDEAAFVENILRASAAPVPAAGGRAALPALDANRRRASRKKTRT